MISAAAHLARRLGARRRGRCAATTSSKDAVRAATGSSAMFRNTPDKAFMCGCKVQINGPGAAGKWTDACDRPAWRSARSDRRTQSQPARRDHGPGAALSRPAASGDPIAGPIRMMCRRQLDGFAARRLFMPAARRPARRPRPTARPRHHHPLRPAGAALSPRSITAPTRMPSSKSRPALLAAATAPDGTISGVQRTWLDRTHPAKAPLPDPRNRRRARMPARQRHALWHVRHPRRREGIETMLALKSVWPTSR